MAIPPGRGDLNKKILGEILEELELSKKTLKQSGTVPVLATTTSTLSTANSLSGGNDGTLPPAQRQALNAAHLQSFGYYIPQDSSFGNLILGVIPRS